MLNTEGLKDIKFGSEMRNEFNLSKGDIFLNHGSYGCVPKRVQDVQRRFQDETANHPDDWFRKTVYKRLDESQKAVAGFLHCDPQDLVFVENATTGVNTILKSCSYKPGDIILYNCLTYGAVAYTCKAVAERHEGVKAIPLEFTLPIKSVDQICQTVEDFLKANPSTKIAVFDYITSPTALVMPVKRLTNICKQHGVLVMIDGAHAPGQVPVNLQELDCDFFTGNFHKWVYTPRGCAALYVKRDHHSWVETLVTSWYYRERLSDRFSLIGTRDDTPQCTVKYAVEFYNCIGGLDKILAYTSKLSADGHACLLERLGSSVERLQVPLEMESPNMKLLRLPHLRQYPPVEGSGDALLEDFRVKYGIQLAFVEVQGSLYVRVSAQIYNTLDEFRKLADCLFELIQDQKKEG